MTRAAQKQARRQRRQRAAQARSKTNSPAAKRTPQRTPEELVTLRAEREAKRAPHVDLFEDMEDRDFERFEQRAAKALRRRKNGHEPKPITGKLDGNLVVEDDRGFLREVPRVMSPATRQLRRGRRAAA